jgi:hypothetical protein
LLDVSLDEFFRFQKVLNQCSDMVYRLLTSGPRWQGLRWSKLFFIIIWFRRNLHLTRRRNITQEILAATYFSNHFGMHGCTSLILFTYSNFHIFIYLCIVGIFLVSDEISSTLNACGWEFDLIEGFYISKFTTRTRDSVGNKSNDNSRHQWHHNNIPCT